MCADCVFEHGPFIESVVEEVVDRDVHDIDFFHVHAVDVFLTHKAEVSCEGFSKVWKKWYFGQVTHVQMVILRPTVQFNGRVLNPSAHGFGIEKNTVAFFKPLTSRCVDEILIDLFSFSCKVAPGKGDILPDQKKQAAVDPSDREHSGRYHIGSGDLFM